jgi:hypothetical protein
MATKLLHQEKDTFPLTMALEIVSETLNLYPQLALLAAREEFTDVIGRVSR